VVTVSLLLLLLRSAETVHGRSDRAAHLTGPGGPGRRLLLTHHERLLGRAEAKAGELGGGRPGGGSQRGGRTAREHPATAGRTHRPKKKKKKNWDINTACHIESNWRSDSTSTAENSAKTSNRYHGVGIQIRIRILDSNPDPKCLSRIRFRNRPKLLSL
jgi:hypothetical protein